MHEIATERESFPRGRAVRRRVRQRLAAQAAHALRPAYLEAGARIVEGLLQRAHVHVADVDVQVRGVDGAQKLVLRNA